MPPFVKGRLIFKLDRAVLGGAQAVEDGALGILRLDVGRSGGPPRATTATRGEVSFFKQGTQERKPKLFYSFLFFSFLFFPFNRCGGLFDRQL